LETVAAEGYLILQSVACSRANIKEVSHKVM